MKSNIVRLATSILGALLFVVTQNASADCVVTGVTGSGGEVVLCSAADVDGYVGTANGDDVTVPLGATVDNPAGNGIQTIGGDDVILVSGGTITGTNAAIAGGAGIDTITINSGSLTGAQDGIRGGGGADTIIINGGTVAGTADVGVAGNASADLITLNGGAIISGDDGIRGNGGADMITVNGGSITAGDTGIRGGGANDTIVLNGGSITGATAGINGQAGDDAVTINGDVVIVGVINGGGGVDTLQFSMLVPQADIAVLQAALLAANPAADSIFINGNTYTWQNFEAITSNLRAIPINVPTVQQWMRILLALMLSLVGLAHVRKLS